MVLQWSGYLVLQGSERLVLQGSKRLVLQRSGPLVLQLVHSVLVCSRGKLGLPTDWPNLYCAGSWGLPVRYCLHAGRYWGWQ